MKRMLSHGSFYRTQIRTACRERILLGWKRDQFKPHSPITVIINGVNHTGRARPAL